MRLKSLLDKEGITPDLYSLDQCFMINPEDIRLIIKTAELKPTDYVLEIGAGTGMLTKKLCKAARKVIAVEKDRRLIKILSRMLSKEKNVEIVSNDIIKTGIPQVNKIVSNLPYGIVDWFFEQLQKTDI